MVMGCLGAGQKLWTAPPFPDDYITVVVYPLLSQSSLTWVFQNSLTQTWSNFNSSYFSSRTSINNNFKIKIKKISLFNRRKPKKSSHKKATKKTCYSKNQAENLSPNESSRLHASLSTHEGSTGRIHKLPLSSGKEVKHF
uniref:Uncharacterized protein n=1 Tax=Cacopsylla melanoneura TaxID=428564 RepID=A0A8D8YRP9_9HEMI